MSSAIIDDIIGIIVLTFVIGFKDPNSAPMDVVIRTGLFILFSFGVGIISYYAFKFIDKRYPHKRRIPILGLALCMMLILSKAFEFDYMYMSATAMVIYNLIVTGLTYLAVNRKKL